MGDLFSGLVSGGGSVEELSPEEEEEINHELLERCFARWTEARAHTARTHPNP
jgi:hypothetical protein